MTLIRYVYEFCVRYQIIYIYITIFAFAMRVDGESNVKRRLAINNLCCSIIMKRLFARYHNVAILVTKSLNVTAMATTNVLQVQSHCEL